MTYHRHRGRCHILDYAGATSITSSTSGSSSINGICAARFSLTWASYVLNSFLLFFQNGLQYSKVTPHALCLLGACQNSFVIGFAYSLLMLLIKNAILIEWIRIFVPLHTRNAFYWASTILIGLNTMIDLSAIFSEVGSCRPWINCGTFGWLEAASTERRATPSTLSSTLVWTCSSSSCHRGSFGA